MANSTWRKSSRCANGGCVEVAFGGPTVLVRGTQRPDVVLAVAADAWKTFLEGVGRGEFDLA